jgi:hypothetical protein
MTEFGWGSSKDARQAMKKDGLLSAHVFLTSICHGERFGGLDRLWSFKLEWDVHITLSHAFASSFEKGTFSK